MQIVINIGEEVYKRTLPYKDVPVISNLANDYPELTHAVANGTPLPKGHGRIVDENKITKCEQIGLVIKHGNVTPCLITDAPTIIEADK